MRYLTLYIILLLFWLLLTFDLGTANLLTGAVAALIATLFFGRYFVKGVKKFYQPARYFWLLVYLFIFIWECLKANLDVAYRVLHPRLPINPGIVKIKTKLKNELSQTALANSITLTPGTMTVDINEDEMYIHWIDVKEQEIGKASEKIAGRFEKIIERVFE